VCCKKGQIGTAIRWRTGPATHTPKSSASLSWPSRPYRASGQPSCGKRLHRQRDAVGVDGSRANTDGGAYKRARMRIARSDGGNRPSSRFPSSFLQPNSGSTLAEESRLTINSNRGKAGSGAHKYVSAVSAEIGDGTLPEKRLSPRSLRHNVLIRTPDPAGRPHGGAGRTARPAW
jgi:hypothetical protein